MAGNELDPDFAAHKKATALGDHDLEALGAMVSCAVELACTQQRDVVLLPEVVHELRHKLFRREAAEPAVLRRHDYVKAAMGVCDLAAALEPPERGSDRRQRAA
jgi:hypothetical protein